MQPRAPKFKNKKSVLFSSCFYFLDGLLRVKIILLEVVTLQKCRIYFKTKMYA